jgi:hypothetical protein
MYFCLTGGRNKKIEKIAQREALLLVLTNTTYYLVYQTNGGKMDGECVTYQEEEKWIQVSDEET